MRYVNPTQIWQEQTISLNPASSPFNLLMSPPTSVLKSF